MAESDAKAVNLKIEKFILNAKFKGRCESRMVESDGKRDTVCSKNVDNEKLHLSKFGRVTYAFAFE
jgi:hypothetical protein